MVLRSHLWYRTLLTDGSAIWDHIHDFLEISYWGHIYIILRSHLCHVFEIIYVTSQFTHRRSSNMGSHTWLLRNIIGWGHIYIILRSHSCHFLRSYMWHRSLLTDGPVIWDNIHDISDISYWGHIYVTFLRSHI